MEAGVYTAFWGSVQRKYVLYTYVSRKVPQFLTIIEKYISRPRSFWRVNCAKLLSTWSPWVSGEDYFVRWPPAKPCLYFLGYCEAGILPRLLWWAPRSVAPVLATGVPAMSIKLREPSMCGVCRVCCDGKVQVCEFSYPSLLAVWDQRTV